VEYLTLSGVTFARIFFSHEKPKSEECGHQFFIVSGFPKQSPLIKESLVVRQFKPSAIYGPKKCNFHPF
jgi:hypothetical protein